MVGEVLEDLIAAGLDVDELAAKALAPEGETARRLTAEDIAAEKLGASRERLVVDNGIVSVKGDAAKQVSYGALARGQALVRTVDEKAVLKAVKDFEVMGQSPTRLDAVAKVTGTAEFPADRFPPGAQGGELGEGAAELALTGLYGGNVESVVLDRVRIDANGDHWIVDYKTSTHEGGDLEGFLAAETDRYRPQLARYADIYRNFAAVQVRCALYFPLLKEFVEVDVRT